MTGWYVAVIQDGKEQKFANWLSDHNEPFYMPMAKITNKLKSKHRPTVKITPAFYNFCFVKDPDINLLKSFPGFDGLYGQVQDTYIELLQEMQDTGFLDHDMMEHPDLFEETVDFASNKKEHLTLFAINGTIVIVPLIEPKGE